MKEKIIKVIKGILLFFGGMGFIASFFAGLGRIYNEFIERSNNKISEWVGLLIIIGTIYVVYYLVKNYELVERKSK